MAAGSSACKRAARMRSSGTTTFPCTSVWAWKMPRSGVCDHRRGLLSDLVAQVRPSAQSARQTRAGTDLADPARFGAHHPRSSSLLRPVKVDTGAEDLGSRPLDVRAQRTWRRVHEKYTAGVSTVHDGSPPGRFEIRLPQRSRHEPDDQRDARGVQVHTARRRQLGPGRHATRAPRSTRRTRMRTAPGPHLSGHGPGSRCPLASPVSSTAEDHPRRVAGSHSPDAPDPQHLRRRHQRHR